MPTKTVSDYILEVLTPVYGVATGEGLDAGSVQELLKRWWSGEGNSGNPTNQALFDRYTAAGAVGASLQDKALDFWGRGLLKSGVRLPGTAGNYISSPDSVLNSVTGDIDIRVCVKVDNWNTGVIQCFVGKRAAFTGYQFRISATGQFDYIWGNGISDSFVGSSGWVPPANGAIKWLRVTHDVDNGSGQNVRVFYYSDDGLTWTQISTSTGTGVTNIADGGAILTLGADGTGASALLAGTIYYAEVRDGIDGRIVAKFDSSTIQKTGAALPASVNGWSVNGSAVRRIDDYVKLPGAAGNYLSHPDSVANNVTGDIDIRVKVAPDDWTPTAEQSFYAKWTTTGNQRSYELSLKAGGEIGFRSSVDGAASTIDTQSTSATGFIDGTAHWVRATLDVDDGAAQKVLTFYTSDNGIVWSQLGNVITTATITSIFDSTAIVEIGSVAVGTVRLLAGKIYYAEVRNGIDGPVVASFDARDITTPWTMNGSGWSYEASSFVEKPEVALDIPGTSGGGYVSTPNAASQLLGDADFRVKVALDDWSDPVNFQAFISKRDGVADAWQFRVNTGGALSLVVFSGGVNVGTNTPAPLGFTPGSVHWLRVTYDADNGAAGRVLTFYESFDNGISWTVIGSPITVAGAKIIDASTAIVTLGSGALGTNQMMNGKLYYAEVRNGIDGPIVARFDASAIAKTGTRLPATVTQQPGYPAANLLTPNQASIETDATGWSSGNNTPTLAQDATQFLDGTKSLSITATAVGPADMDASLNPNNTAIGVPGKSYTVKASYKANSTTRNGKAQVGFRNAALGLVGSPNGSAVSVTSGAWINATVEAVAPALTAFVSMKTLIDQALITEKFFADRMSIEETPTPWTINGSAWSWEQVA